MNPWLRVTFFCFILFLAGCVQSKDEGAVLARFDGSSITTSTFMNRLSALPNELKNVMVRRKKEFLDEMVDEHFLMKEALRRKIDQQSDVKDLIEAAKRKIIISKLIQVDIDEKAKIGPEEVLRYYDTHSEEFMSPLRMRASQILLETETEANAAKADIDSGMDFETVAKNRSIDRTSKKGGDIGYFQKGQLIPEFEEVALRMKLDEVSAIFHTQYGYHILKITERIEPALRDFKLVRGQVERQLIREKRNKNYKSLVQKLKGNAKVVVDEKGLEAITLSKVQ